MLDKIAALIVKEKKLLLVREHGKKTFALPGGKRRFGESDEQTLRRELMEELNVKISSMKYYGKFDDIGYGLVRIIVYICGVDGTPTPSREIEEMQWADSGSDMNIHKTTKEKIMPEIAEEKIIG